MTSTPVADRHDDPSSTSARRKSPKLIAILVTVLVLGAGASWFFLRPSGGAPEPVPGEVVTLDPVQVNLAGGRYLKVGIALQLTAEAEEADGSRALDALIAQYSGRTLADITLPEVREKMQYQLQARIEKLYDGDVMAVYLTNFVTQ